MSTGAGAGDRTAVSAGAGAGERADVSTGAGAGERAGAEGNRTFLFPVGEPQVKVLVVPDVPETLECCPGLLDPWSRRLPPALDHPQIFLQPSQVLAGM